MVLGLLPAPKNPAKDMSDLLSRLENMTFSGYELSYSGNIHIVGAWTDMHYSPGKLKSTKTLGQDVTELELHLDCDFLVDKVVEMVQKTPFQWSQANMDTREMELLDNMLNDPRHILAHAANVQELGSGLYRMELTGPISRMAQTSGITLYVEINMMGSYIQGMNIKKSYDGTGIEELVRGVSFY